MAVVSKICPFWNPQSETSPHTGSGPDTVGKAGESSKDVELGGNVGDGGVELCKAGLDVVDGTVFGGEAEIDGEAEADGVSAVADEVEEFVGIGALAEAEEPPDPLAPPDHVIPEGIDRLLPVDEGPTIELLPMEELVPSAGTGKSDRPEVELSGLELAVVDAGERVS